MISSEIGEGFESSAMLLKKLTKYCSVPVKATEVEETTNRLSRWISQAEVSTKEMYARYTLDQSKALTGVGGVLFAARICGSLLATICSAGWWSSCDRVELRSLTACWLPVPSVAAVCAAAIRCCNLSTLRTRRMMSSLQLCAVWLMTFAGSQLVPSLRFASAQVLSLPLASRLVSRTVIDLMAEGSLAHRKTRKESSSEARPLKRVSKGTVGRTLARTLQAPCVTILSEDVSVQASVGSMLAVTTSAAAGASPSMATDQVTPSIEPSTWFCPLVPSYGSSDFEGASPAVATGLVAGAAIPQLCTLS